MPIYEYQHEGKACSLGKVFEYEQSIKDEALAVCPDCGKPVKRLVGSTNINLRKARGAGLPKRKRGKGAGMNLIGDGKKSR